MSESTDTFVPDVYVDVTREQYQAWLEAGKPSEGPNALPAGAIPISAAGLNRLGQALQVASEIAGAAATADALASAQTVLQASINARTTTAQAQGIAQAAIAAFVGSAPAELDTWPEVVAYLASLAATDSSVAGQLTALSQSIAAKYTKPGAGIPVADLDPAVLAPYLKSSDAAATYVQKEGTLRAANAFLAWWSEPRAMCHQPYDLTFAQAATSAGEFLNLTIDPRGRVARRVVAGTLAMRDDHNAGAVLVFPDRPALTAYSGHDVESAVHSRKNNGTNGVAGDGSVDSLKADVLVGATVPNGAVTTYSALFRRPGSSIVLAMTRVSGQDWRWTYSTNAGDSWTAFATNALIDFTGTATNRKGYIIGWDDVANAKIHLYLYNNPSQDDRNLYHLVFDWASENFIKPSTGAVVGSLRSPSAKITVSTDADVIYTCASTKRFRLSHGGDRGDVFITEYTVTSGVAAGELVALEPPTSGVLYTRLPLGIATGEPFGGVTNAPYFAGMSSPCPQPAGKKVLFWGHNVAGTHFIKKRTVTSSWSQPGTDEVVATSTRPLVRLACPINAGSLDVLWTEVLRYGGGYGDSDADINFFGDLVAHYRPAGEAIPPRVLPPNLAPLAGFTYTSNALAFTFTSTASDADGTIASTAWDFGDGTTATGTPVSKTYAAAGTYTVTQTVTDNQGATATASQTVTATATPAAALSTSSVASGASASGSSTDTSLSWAHTNESGVTQMLVFVGHNNAGGAQEIPSAVTYNGAAMTLVDSVVAGSGATSGRVGSVWRLANPTADGGAYNVVVSKTTGARLAGISAGWRGASATLGTVVKDTSDTARTSATTVTSSPTTSQVAVFDVFAGLATLTPGANGTARTSKGSSTNLQVNLSTWAGGSSITETNTLASAALLAQIAVPVLAA